VKPAHYAKEYDHSHGDGSLCLRRPSCPASSLVFASSTVYVWTGLGNMTWNSMTFVGVGDFASVSAMSENSDVEAKGITIGLSGIPSDMMSEVLTEVRILGNVNIWLALFDNTGALIADPILSYQGKMDAPTLNDDGQTCTAQITVENVLVDLNRPRYRRYTDDDQQLDLAATLTALGLPSATTDTGFRWGPGIQEMQPYWGQSPVSNNN
jgi:hypothetical protein